MNSKTMQASISPQKERPAGSSNEDVQQILENKLETAGHRKWLMQFIAGSVTAALVVFLLFGLILGISIVNGVSMEPTLKDGDIAFFQRVFSRYNHGDILLIDRGDHIQYIKRVVGLPGDTVNIDDIHGNLLINGEVVQEKYVYKNTFSRPEGIHFPLLLKEDEYFVLGDNRDGSLDSRAFGAVNKKDIKGKLIFFFRTGF